MKSPDDDRADASTTEPRFWADRMLPAVLQGAIVGGMALFAAWTGFDPVLIGASRE